MTSVHRPFDVRIFHKIARSLANSGRSVCLIACHTESGQFGGVRLEAVGSYAGRLKRMLLTAPKVALSAYRTGARICHFHDPELIPAALVLRILGRRVVYDVHEDVPRQIAVKHWIPAWLRTPIAWLVEGVELLAARAFDRIVAATPKIAKRFPPAKTVTVQNFPILGELFSGEQTRYGERSNIITYIGVISRERGALEMLESMCLLPERFDARLELAGSIGSPALTAEMAAHRGWAHTDFLGVIDRPGVKQLLDKSRVGLVLFHPAANHTEAQPNKIFEYMSAGIPVVASDFPLWREFVGKTRAGLLVDPMNTGEIAKAIEWLLTHQEEAEAMGRRGREAVERTFNWSHEEEKLLAMYDSLEREDRSRA